MRDVPEPKVVIAIDHAEEKRKLVGKRLGPVFAQLLRSLSTQRNFYLRTTEGSEWKYIEPLAECDEDIVDSEDLNSAVNPTYNRIGHTKAIAFHTFSGPLYFDPDVLDLACDWNSEVVGLIDMLRHKSVLSRLHTVFPEHFLRFYFTHHELTVDKTYTEEDVEFGKPFLDKWDSFAPPSDPISSSSHSSSSSSILVAGVADLPAI